jgi:hypothetical protein
VVVLGEAARPMVVVVVELAGYFKALFQLPLVHL